MPQPPQLTPTQSPDQIQSLRSRTPKPWLTGGVVVGGILGLALSSSPIALAEYKADSKTNSGIGTNTTRGECGKSAWPGMLTPLAPVTYIGLTSSTHPTFAWYVSARQPDPKQPNPIDYKRSYLMRLRLYEYSPNRRGQPIQEREIQISSPGVMQVALDKTQPGLVMGKTYRWQVALVCNPQQPSGSLWKEAVVKVVALPEQVKVALAKTNDRQQRVDLYAGAGLWYEALAETLSPPDSNQPILKQSILALLRDLIGLEQPNQQRDLSQVVAIEQPKSRLPR